MSRRKRKTVQIGEELWEAVRDVAEKQARKITAQVELFLRSGVEGANQGNDAGGLYLIKKWIDKLNLHELSELMVYISSLLRKRVESAAPELNKEVLIRFLKENWHEINNIDVSSQPDSGLSPAANPDKIEQLAGLVIQRVDELKESEQIKDQFIQHLVNGELTLADVCLLGEELDLCEEEVERLWKSMQVLMALRKGVRNEL